jgi:hypothetical protein
VEGIEAIERPGQRIPTVKLEGIVRLWLDIYAHHLKPRAVVAHRRPARPAKQI